MSVTEFVAVLLALIVGFGAGFYVGVRMGHGIAARIDAEIKAGRLTKDDAASMVSRVSDAYRKGTP